MDPLWLLLPIVVVFLVWLCYDRITGLLWPVSLRGKTILITGCDTGFGNALASRLATVKGLTTLAACLTEEGERNLARIAGIGLDGGRLITIRMDVTKRESVDDGLRRVEEVIGVDGGLWALINNAGILGAPAPSDWLTIDDWQRPMDVNCLGTIRVTQTFVPLIKRQGGRIVIITSMASRFIMPYSGPYCVSKYGARAYADCLRHEMSNFGVSVYLIEPGFMRTPLIREAGSVLREIWRRQSKNVRAEYDEEYSRNAAEFLNRSIGMLSSRRTHIVPDACIHAIMSRFPKRRYVLGIDSNIFLSLVWLPTWMNDVIMDAFLVLNRYPEVGRSKKGANESG